MKSRKLCFRSGIIICLFFGILSHTFGQEIELLSYNIRYPSPDDGPNLWEYRKTTMLEALSTLKPDIMGMQEVVHSQLITLSEALKDYDYIGVGREDGKTKGEYSPIFYLKEELKLLDSNTFWLSETPNQISIGWDAALERICTYARFLHQQSGQEFWVFNTHFDHRGIEARAQSVTLILNQIKKLNQEGLPVFLTGDFNLTPDQEPIKVLQKAFKDIQQKIDPNAPNYGTFTGFDPTTNGKQRIDYIFQNGFKVIEASHLWLKTEKGLWVSDHHPVYGKFLFTN